MYGIPNNAVRELAGHPARNIVHFLCHRQAGITPPLKDEHAG
jgi:hypothetical protein